MEKYLARFPHQDREKVMKAWLLSVTEPPVEADEAGGGDSAEKRKKQLEKKALDTEELPFLLQSGVLLCRWSQRKRLKTDFPEGSSTSCSLPMASPGQNCRQELCLPREATSGLCTRAAEHSQQTWILSILSQIFSRTPAKPQTRTIEHL